MPHTVTPPQNRSFVLINKTDCSTHIACSRSSRRNILQQIRQRRHDSLHARALKKCHARQCAVALHNTYVDGSNAKMSGLHRVRSQFSAFPRQAVGPNTCCCMLPPLCCIMACCCCCRFISSICCCCIMACCCTCGAAPIMPCGCIIPPWKPSAPMPWFIPEGNDNSSHHRSTHKHHLRK